jgi:hypothetical protein
MISKPVVVVGDGWAALGTVGFLVSSGVEVHWISGSGARMQPPLASLEVGPGVAIWVELAAQLSIDCGEIQYGSYVREYRNKAFRAPAWTKAPTAEARAEVRDEVLWDPERRFVGPFDARFKLTLGEIEEEIRNILTPGNFKNLKRIDEVPITGFKKVDGHVTAVLLGSGKEIECDQVIYADRWSLLYGLEGLPKSLPFLRKRGATGMLQANFHHHPPVGAGVQESFFAPLHKESGETAERRVWGCFASDGKKSTWTICLAPDEVENNHEIAKKLRRLKGTLDKVFSNNGFITAENTTFASTLTEEQLLFFEELIFAEGEPMVSPLTLESITGILFLTDGYGPSWALAQVGGALGIEPKSAEPQAENVDFLDSPAP